MSRIRVAYAYYVPAIMHVLLFLTESPSGAAFIARRRVRDDNGVSLDEATSASTRRNPRHRTGGVLPIIVVRQEEKSVELTQLLPSVYVD